VPIAVAYLDIDDFKDFNTRHTETKVDLNLLVPFMEAIEAHVFSHGHAYRFGGDEYLLTLPNQDRGGAVASLRALQARIAAAPYRGMHRAPTVSVGLCLVDVDCFLTDREIQGRANAAKNHAKATEKGRIATFGGILFREADLELV
jgi:diguanylate cyclase (GGDEF)-like protein